MTSRSTSKAHRTNRINAAYVIGGPDLLVETVQDVTGVPVNHYIEIDFVGFAALVDSLGGVEIDFECAARDTKSGLAVDAGPQTLDGEMAIAYVRSRSLPRELRRVMGYRRQRRHRPHRPPAGPAARRVRSSGVPVQCVQHAELRLDFRRADQADEGLSAGVIVDLGRSALSLNRSTIHTTTLPVKNHSEGGRSYVIMVQPDADEVLTAFINGDPFPS